MNEYTIDRVRYRTFSAVLLDNNAALKCVSGALPRSLHGAISDDISYSSNISEGLRILKVRSSRILDTKVCTNDIVIDVRCSIPLAKCKCYSEILRDIELGSIPSRQLMQSKHVHSGIHCTTL